MRIACLVMGYIAPAVLARSVPILREAGWEVFVHVDRKVAMDGYRRAMGDAAQSCVFVASPVEVFWGGYSMIAAELLLIETARKHAAYDKFLLLSDDSFPVLPPDALRRHFDNESDQITLRRVREGTPTHARYRDFVCYDDVATTIRDVSTVVPGSPLRVIRPELEKRIAEIAALRRRGKKRLQLYYGQGLWALTKATLDIVTRTIETDRHLQRSFVYSALPDETMIHSIVGNFVRPTEQEATPVYVNYSGGAPVVYAAMTDLPLDLRETHAFLRKLSPTATETLDILAARLQTGRTIHDQIPGEANAPLWIVDEAGTRREVIRLSAPDEIESAEGWHAIEVFWGRRFPLDRAGDGGLAAAPNRFGEHPDRPVDGDTGRAQLALRLPVTGRRPGGAGRNPQWRSRRGFRRRFGSGSDADHADPVEAGRTSLSNGHAKTWAPGRGVAACY